MANGGITPCEYARNRHQNAVRWLNLWTGLLFVFASAVVLVLVLVILFFLRSSWVAGAVSTIATIVDGVAIRWVYARRQESLQEEKDAYSEVTKQCTADHEQPAQQAAADLRLQAKLTTFFR